MHLVDILQGESIAPSNLKKLMIDVIIDTLHEDGKMSFACNAACFETTREVLIHRWVSFEPVVCGDAMLYFILTCK